MAYRIRVRDTNGETHEHLIMGVHAVEASYNCDGRYIPFPCRMSLEDALKPFSLMDVYKHIFENRESRNYFIHVMEENGYIVEDV
jgi:hypothetical protein